MSGKPRRDPRWIEKNLASPEAYNQQGFNASALGKEVRSHDWEEGLKDEGCSA